MAPNYRAGARMFAFGTLGATVGTLEVTVGTTVFPVVVVVVVVVAVFPVVVVMAGTWEGTLAAPKPME